MTLHIDPKSKAGRRVRWAIGGRGLTSNGRAWAGLPGDEMGARLRKVPR